VAPAATPPEVINRIHAAIVQILKLPKIQERFLTLGMDAVGNTPADFSTFIKTDINQWTALTKKLNLSAQ